jgi:hypothetical protein
MKSVFAALFCLLAAGAAAPAAQDFPGLSLRDQREQDDSVRRLADEVAYTSEVCGTTIASSIDRRSLRDWPAFSDLVSACDGALGAVEASCRAGRTGLVREFVCAGDASGARLRGGVLRYGAAPTSDGFAQTKAVLDAAR